MYKFNDRRKLAKAMANSLQDLVYGKVEVNEDIILQKFKLYILNERDFNYSCDISEVLYKIETQDDVDMYVDEIFTDYKRMILGRYIV